MPEPSSVSATTSSQVSPEPPAQPGTPSSTDPSQSWSTVSQTSAAPGRRPESSSAQSVPPSQATPPTAIAGAPSPSMSTGLLVQPAAPQRSVVQGFPSSQLVPGLVWQLPSTHASTPLQAMPSAPHSASVLQRLGTQPLTGSQRSLGAQRLSSGPCRQRPPTHWSTVQATPSSQPPGHSLGPASTPPPSERGSTPMSNSVSSPSKPVSGSMTALQPARATRSAGTIVSARIRTAP